MKRGWMAAALAVLLSLTGCCRDLLPRARDITTVELMQVLALDEGAGDQLRVTASSGVHAGTQGGRAQPPVVLCREAESVFAACTEMQGSAGGYTSFSHVEQVVLSTQTAQRSTAGLLDYLEREPELRLDALVWLTEGEAGALLEQVREEHRSAAELLEALSRELRVESRSWTVSVRELLSDLEDNGCALLPVLELDQEGDEATLRCSGMGWFQEDDYRAVLSPELSGAAAMLEGEMNSGAAEVRLPGERLAGLRLTGAHCRWRPVWEGERLTAVTAEVELRADLAQMQGTADLSDPEEQARMRRALERQIQQRLTALLRLSQSVGGDFLHIQRKLRVLSPRRSRTLDLHWAQWFPTLELKAQVRGGVERSYDLRQGRER